MRKIRDFLIYLVEYSKKLSEKSFQRLRFQVNERLEFSSYATAE